MLMLQMSGGLGNQMFVYARYLSLKEQGKKVCIDDETKYAREGRFDNRLEEIFSLSYEHADRKEYDRLTDSSLFFLKRIRRKLFGRRPIYQEENPLLYSPEAQRQDDSYCVGYWQSIKYFENVESLLRQRFRFDWEHFPGKVLECREELEGCNAVSVHVRRGDYQNEKFSPIYGGICTEAYYRSAMEYLRENERSCRFFLFTDDREWGRGFAKENGMELVDCAQEERAEHDMALMSICRHHIIANSSYSWWGAWLDPNEEKIVVAPARWLNTYEGADIYYQLCNVRIDAAGRVAE